MVWFLNYCGTQVQAPPQWKACYVLRHYSRCSPLHPHRSHCRCCVCGTLRRTSCVRHFETGCAGTKSRLPYLFVVLWSLSWINLHFSSHRSCISCCRATKSQTSSSASRMSFTVYLYATPACSLVLLFHSPMVAGVGCVFVQPKALHLRRRTRMFPR